MPLNSAATPSPASVAAHTARRPAGGNKERRSSLSWSRCKQPRARTVRRAGLLHADAQRVQRVPGEHAQRAAQRACT